MSITQPQLVLFDLDGTLVDSAPDLAAAINLMLQDLGRERRDPEEIRNFIGNGQEALVKRALTGHYDMEPDDETFAHALPCFQTHYSATLSQRSTLFPGVLKALAHLHERAIPMGCVTNKATRFTTPLLDALGISDDFAVVICGDTLAQKKPAPEPILHAAAQMGVAPRQCLMVGDTITDILAARAAGCGILGVSYGYYNIGAGNIGAGADSGSGTGTGNIRDAAPDCVVDSLADLVALIN